MEILSAFVGADHKMSEWLSANGGLLPVVGHDRAKDYCERPRMSVSVVETIAFLSANEQTACMDAP